MFDQQQQNEPTARRARTVGWLTRTLAAADRRFRRARPGSVLIVVVALLVLIALAGTALIVTVRTDRFAVGQNTANTQIELLVDAVVRLSKAQLVDDLFGHSQFRPATATPPLNAVAAATGEYEHTDWPATDPWLASRTPERIGAGDPYWPYVSAPMVNGQPFESPDGGLNASPAAARVATYAERTRVEPTFLRVGGETHPAIFVYNGNTRYGPYLGADADGDGIADGGLFRVPVGQLNGVTYYAGVRIIDNSAAFNANVHWRPNRDITSPAPFVPGDLFTTNVDFQGAMFDYNDTGAPAAPAGFYGAFTRDWQMFGLNAFRTNDPTYIAGTTPPGGTPPALSTTPPVGDVDPTVLRTDFEWVSLFDQWYHQFARRLDSPGYFVRPGTRGPTDTGKFRALASEDATSLAYRFVLRNPNALVASPLEQMLLPTLEFPVDPNRAVGTNARMPRTRTNPYPPPGATGRGPVVDWFTDNFDMMGVNRTDRVFSRRAITVPRNPMSNAMPLPDMGSLPAEVKVVVNTADDQAAQPNLMPVPGPNFGMVSRASINTAPFGELWRAFWAVMNAHPGENLATTNVPTLGAKIFRNPLRRPAPSTPAPGTVSLDATNTLLLRAAIAAVNAEDYRDSDTYTDGARNENVTSRRIFLNATVAGTPNTPIEVMVFGSEAQPFITEVYANNESAEHVVDPPPPVGGRPTKQNAKGYVAVELYNPTNVPINLSGWHLGLIRRKTAATTVSRAYPDMTVMPLGGFTGFGASGPIIQPNGYLILENYNPADIANGAAEFRPLNATFVGTPSTFYVRDLHQAIGDSATPGGELVLLRPRRGDGAPMTLPLEGITELGRPQPGSTLSVNLDELVPLDSFDFTGFQLVAAAGGGAAEFQELHYVRQCGGTADARWKCVYPGRWRELEPPANTMPMREEGAVISAPFIAPDNPESEPSAWSTNDSNGHAINLGTANAASSYLNPYPGIQLNNKDSAGPNRVGTSTNHFPFGGFTRNGDILQIPFIGAYTIRTRVNANAGRVPIPAGSTNPSRAIFLEMNSVSRDSGRAQDDDQRDPAPLTAQPVFAYDFDDAYEMIGRFCPLRSLSKQFDPANGAIPRDGQGNPVDPYAWSMDLFDYLTVDAPQGSQPQAITPLSPTGARLLEAERLRSHGDYFPNVKPSNYGIYSSGQDFTELDPSGRLRPQAVDANDARQGNESRPSIDGKINLNTAPARVIAAMNFWPSGADANNNGIDDNNELLANMIVRWRDGDPATGAPPRGPFNSIYDLNRVFDPANVAVRFQNGANTITPDPDTVPTSTFQPNAAQGDLSPRDGSDEVTNDFEARYLMMNRISNMVSTRSDSYTVYIVVQGWRGVGTPNPTLAVQRRAAYIADRSQITATNRDFTPVIVPTN